MGLQSPFVFSSCVRAIKRNSWCLKLDKLLIWWLLLFSGLVALAMSSRQCTCIVNWLLLKWHRRVLCLFWAFGRLYHWKVRFGRVAFTADVWVTNLGFSDTVLFAWNVGKLARLASRYSGLLIEWRVMERLMVWFACLRDRCLDVLDLPLAK